MFIHVHIFVSREAFVFEFGVAEVDEETDFDPGGVQIIDDLCLVFGGNGFDCLQLDDHFLFNKYIRAKVTNAFTSKHHFDRVL